ncbi:MAG: alpha/beta hydrolase [Oceanicoccus sp.]
MFNKMYKTVRNLIAALLAVSGSQASAQDITAQIEHHYANNNGVRIHYARMGSGPLIVMIHGFPDYWYTWRHQMQALSEHYTVAAMDTRGYNLSDQPEGVENYDLTLLVGDVAAVIDAEKAASATIVGHDWGGGIAWAFAAHRPDLTKNLITLNLPHPKNLVRELVKFGQQHENSKYARNFQLPNSHERITAEHLAKALAGEDEALYEKYHQAFSRSSPDAMMNYYRANYPREPYTSGAFAELPVVQAPVLQFHGLNDTALLSEGLNNTWDYLKKDYTLVTIPGVGHWPHRERPEQVSNMIKAWLSLQEEK